MALPSGVIDADADLIYDMALGLVTQVVQAQKLNGLPTFKSIRSTPMYVVPPASELPRLGVYLSTTGQAEGDANTGEPRFNSIVTLTLSGAIVFSDDEEQFRTLRALIKQLKEALLTNAKFVRAVNGGFPRYDYRFAFSKEGETPIAEAQLLLQCAYREDFEPVEVDWLKKIVVTWQRKDKPDPSFTRTYDQLSDLFDGVREQANARVETDATKT
jgi:hypothetical protein